MNVEIKGICRGDGHIYAKLVLEDIDPQSEPELRVESTAGTPLPFNCQPLPADGEPDSRAFILTIPLLEKGSQRIVVSDPERPEDEPKTLVIPMGRAKWESRFNYLFRREMAADLRKSDQRELEMGIGFKFIDALPDNRGGVLVNFETWTASGQLDTLEIATFDSAGNRFEAHPTLLGKTATPSVRDSSYVLYIQRYSIRIPDKTYTFTVAARSADDPTLHGFATLEGSAFGGMWELGKCKWENACIDPSYEAWFARHRATEDVLEAQRNAIFGHDVKFSVVVPLYETPLNLLAATVDSVVQQTYANWELMLVNASPDNEGLRQAALDLAAGDPRIRYIQLAGNGGISKNTNEGILASTGEFVAFFDHDDLLEPTVLYEYARAIERHPDTDILYCDEDKVDEKGEKFFYPNFKPEYDIELMRAYNYVCHLLCIRRELLDEVGLCDERFDGAQDHELTLRASEKARRIHHVARMLYHWRAVEGSTAQTADAKGYAHEAGKLAVQSHVQRLGLNAEMDESPFTFVHRVKYLVKGQPLVSIIIPNKDCADLLDTCVRSVLEKTTYGNYEIIIVENNSTEDETFAKYEQLTGLDERVRVITWPAEFNFSKIINFGAADAKGEYLLLLNNDTKVISPEWLEEMLGCGQRDDVGAVGALLLYPDDTIQHAGVVVINSDDGGSHNYVGLPVDNTGYLSQAVLRRTCVAVTAACLLTPKAAFDAVGGFSEEYQVAYNDVDYCLKLGEIGLKSVYDPKARLYHYESVTRGSDVVSVEKNVRFTREKSRLHERWAPLYVKGDPWLNPNLMTQHYRLNNGSEFRLLNAE